MKTPRMPGEDLVVDEDGHLRDDVTRKVVGFVAQYRREHKDGPTWAELANHMGWARAERKGAILTLRAHHILYVTTEPRSIRLHRRLQPTSRQARR